MAYSPGFIDRATEGNYDMVMQTGRINCAGRVAVFLAGVLALVFLPGQSARSGTVAGWADVHVHIDGLPNTVHDSVASLIRGMDEEGMRAAVVMIVPRPTPRSNYFLFASELQRFPDRFRFLGGGGILNPMIQRAVQIGTVPPPLRQRFARAARRILSDGAVGFGEMTAQHISLVPAQPYLASAPDHPLLLLLADIAAEADVVIDFHLDLVIRRIESLPSNVRGNKNPETLEPNLDAFERLVAHNPKAKIVWAHAGSDPLGQWTPTVSRELLARHPNLYMSIRVPPSDRLAPRVIFSNGTVDEEWLGVLREFSDRFMMGGDQFIVSGLPDNVPIMKFSKSASHIRSVSRQFLGALPEDLARKIGYDNVERLYRLPH
jgi:predicted TIM-barrel fold metal-dependent hydrolase